VRDGTGPVGANLLLQSQGVQSQGAVHD
jgi:hypothetical protein